MIDALMALLGAPFVQFLIGLILLGVSAAIVMDTVEPDNEE